MNFFRTQKFSKELKRLTKKYRSLGSDCEKLESVLEKLPLGTGSKHWNKLHVSADGSLLIFKVRLACVSLKGESLLRVVYAYRKGIDMLEYIDFIEIYYKGEKANEDRSLIDAYLKDYEV